MSIKIDPADKAFSQYVRLRDGGCVRCGSRLEINEKGMPVSLQCSHYFGRTMESVRFDPDNCDALCHGCHRYWEKENREAYRDFKVQQLGDEGFIQLTVRANTYKKKDRKMSLIEAKALLQNLLNSRP